MKTNKLLLYFLLSFVSIVSTGAYSQNETISGDLHVTGKLTVDGLTTERMSLFVGGDEAKYYPVWFNDTNWHYGEFDLQIYRPSVHTDGNWKGSMISRFRSHSSSWGHMSNFTESSIRQSVASHVPNEHFIADYKTSTHSSGIIVWLRGQSTYYYHTSDRATITTFNDSGDGYIALVHYQGQDIESYIALDAVNPKILTNGSSISDNFKVEGNLGIGTVANDYKLEVAGTIRAEEVIVEAQPWADYVFKDSYVLPSLSEVESHIAEHGHLPGVPSGESIETAGLSLGQSQAFMMSKIEELTLYAIESEKEVLTLRQTNQRLESELSRIATQLQQLQAAIRGPNGPLNN